MLIDRTPPVPQQWDVLRKHDQALVLWRFDDVSAGTVTIEFSPELAPDVDAPFIDVPDAAQGEKSWQALPPLAAADAAALALSGSARVALPGRGWLRVAARDAAGLLAFSEAVAVEPTLPPAPAPAPPPTPEDEFPTAPVWPGWLTDAEPVAPEQRVVSRQVPARDEASSPAVPTVVAFGHADMAPAPRVSMRRCDRLPAVPARLQRQRGLIWF